MFYHTQPPDGGVVTQLWSSVDFLLPPRGGQTGEHASYLGSLFIYIFYLIFLELTGDSKLFLSNTLYIFIYTTFIVKTACAHVNGIRRMWLFCVIQLTH